MSRGRCSGCGESGSSQAVAAHTAACPGFAVLYREHPERALAPEAEYLRWRQQDRAGEQAARVAGKVSSTDTRRAVMAERFRTRDILEED